MLNFQLALRERVPLLDLFCEIISAKISDVNVIGRENHFPEGKHSVWRIDPGKFLNIFIDAQKGSAPWTGR